LIDNGDGTAHPATFIQDEALDVLKPTPNGEVSPACDDIETEALADILEVEGLGKRNEE